MGSSISLLFEKFPPKSKSNVSDIPDLSGKVMIVTGGNTGVGKATVNALLEHNAKVYLAARNSEKALEAIRDLKATTVKEAAEEFLSKEKELNVLFNNAGVMVPPLEDLTAQRYDLQFGTNVLGHFYFTKLLLPALLTAAKSSPDGKARVVNTSSMASMFADDIDFNALTDTAARKNKTRPALYCQSKLASVLFSNELARRYGDQGIVSTSMNPGSLRSDLQRHLSPLQNIIVQPTLYHASYGALTQLWAGTSPETVSFNGKYLIPWARVGSGNPKAQDTKLASELWKWLDEQVDKEH